MAVGKTNEIDTIQIDEELNEVVLTIIDSLDWTDEYEHLILLQEKLNTYLRFIESKEIYKKCPDAEGRDILIQIYAQHKITKKAKLFINKVNDTLEEAGFKFNHTIYIPVARQNNPDDKSD